MWGLNYEIEGTEAKCHWKGWRFGIVFVSLMIYHRKNKDTSDISIKLLLRLGFITKNMHYPYSLYKKRMRGANFISHLISQSVLRVVSQVQNWIIRLRPVTRWFYLTYQPKRREKFRRYALTNFRTHTGTKLSCLMHKYSRVLISVKSVSQLLEVSGLMAR